EGVTPVRLLDAPDRPDDASERVVPAHRPETLALDADERAAQAIGVLVLHVALDALRAELAAVERELLPGLEADDLLVLDAKLDPALLPAETAMGLDLAIRLADRRPAAGGHLVTVWPERIDDLFDGDGERGHGSPLPERALRESNALPATGGTNVLIMATPGEPVAHAELALDLLQVLHVQAGLERLVADQATRLPSLGTGLPVE